MKNGGLTMYCEKCGYSNEEGNMFCGRCGGALNTPTPAQPTMQPTGSANQPQFSQGHTQLQYEQAYRNEPYPPFNQSAYPNQAPAMKLKTKQKSKLPVILAIVLVLAILGGAGAFFGVSAMNTRKYDELIKTGNKFIDEFKYDEAVETFQDAINIKPKREEAYVGAAKGYIGLGESDKAKDILEQGLEKVKKPSDKFTDLCDELGVDYQVDTEETGTGETTQEDTGTTAEETTFETTLAPTTSETETTERPTTTKRAETTTKAQKLVQPDVTAEYDYHATVNADGGLRLRFGPGKNYGIILVIPNGSTVVEAGSGADDEWLYVKYNNRYGWVKSEYLIFEGGMAKPVIYLYPERATRVRVNLNIVNGSLTCTYPAYHHGWDVTAFPDGHLINNADGRQYSYLYWEGTADVKYDFTKGFVVKGSDTAAFLQGKLAEMGLLPNEYNEFIVYWLPLMQGNEYNLISFQDAAYTSTAPLNISPQPDSILRVFMAFKPLSQKIEIEEQVFPQFNRTGFTVVEWGGTEVK